MSIHRNLTSALNWLSQDKRDDIDVPVLSKNWQWFEAVSTESLEDSFVALKLDLSTYRSYNYLHQRALEVSRAN
jgi:hypothetical protein